MLLIACCHVDLFAQGNTAWKKYRHEASVGYGFNSFISAIGENTRPGIPFLLQRSTFNGSYRYFVFKHFAARASLTHGYSRKNDKTVESTRISSRLDYQATITEFAILGEYHLFDETLMARRKTKVRRARGGKTKGLNLGVSFFTGVGFDYMRPYAEYFGELMVLKPYSSMAGYTEVRDYKKMHMHIPVGGQVRAVLSESWRVGLEFGYRFGFNEYIDNVSGVYYTRENPSSLIYPDDKFSGEVVALSKDKAPISTLASRSGRKGFLFGTLTLAYRIKS